MSSAQLSGSQRAILSARTLASSYMWPTHGAMKPTRPERSSSAARSSKPAFSSSRTCFLEWRSCASRSATRSCAAPSAHGVGDGAPSEPESGLADRRELLRGSERSATRSAMT